MIGVEKLNSVVNSVSVNQPTSQNQSFTGSSGLVAVNPDHTI